MRTYRCITLPQPSIHYQIEKRLTIEEIEQILASHNEWVKVIPNDKETTLRELTPAKVTGTLSVPVGRLRKIGNGSRIPSSIHCR